MSSAAPTDIYVVIPTYNEAENIPPLLDQLIALQRDLRIIIVDDNSPDGTGRIVDEYAQRYPGVVIPIHRAGKLGLGTAHIAGFEHAFRLGAQWILSMDADFSHHPRYIPSMIDKAATGYDLVIGSRYVKDGGTSRFPLWRKLLSSSANFTAHLLVGLSAHDTTAAFRLYRREVLESVEFEKIFSSGYSFLIEMLYIIQSKGWKIGEVPIVYEDRQAGQTKISRNEVYRALYTVFRLAGRRIRNLFLPRTN